MPAGHENESQNGNNRAKHQHFFMRSACLAAEQSTEKPKVGACVVNQENRIVGVGYNGLPKKFKFEEKVLVNNPGWYELCVCHAALNAIMSTYSANRKGYTIYLTRYPCNQCAKEIIQSDITHVIYGYKRVPSGQEKKYKAAEEMFEKVDINPKEYNELVPEPRQIDFSYLDN